jgi:hypothetical protein
VDQCACVPPASLMPHIVNPYTPYFLCDRHVGGEDDGVGEHSPREGIAITPLHAGNAARVKPCDVVCVDAVAFDGFASDVLPRLPSQVILFTHRWRLPQVQRSNVTDAVRAHDKVYHWFAQNPIYPSDGRYTAFPYGIRNTMLKVMSSFMLAYHRGRAGAAPPKNTTLEHPQMALTHPSRKSLVAHNARRGRRMRMGAPDYYARIGQTKFLISPRDDRPDTYRHWEAIALGAIPIANIDAGLYGPLFGEDMLFVNDTDAMLALLDRPDSLEGRYHEPHSGRVSTLYWARKVRAVKAACLAGGRAFKHSACFDYYIVMTRK